MLDESNRGARVVTPLGVGVLAVEGFRFNEELSADFDGVLDLLSEDYEIDPLAMLGESVTVQLETRAEPRFFNAVVSDFAFTGASEEGATYQAVLRPWTWVISRNSNCRIFQDMTVPEIIEQVVKDAGFSESFDAGLLDANCPKREYCVQYNESDANFIYRLMEEEGIASFFVHEEGKHTLMLSDWNDDFKPMPGYEMLEYYADGAQRRAAGEIVNGWSLRSSLVPGTFTTRDYDFKIPTQDMENASPSPMEHANAKQEVFEWPGGYVAPADGKRYADIRREALQAGRAQVTGRASARGLCPGHTFALTLFPRADQNKEYLVLRASHDFHITSYRSGADAQSASYECRFLCSDPSLLYRPSVTATRPQIVGPQTAVVVGPEGEEIHTDEHGRIRVRFPWDREGPGETRGTDAAPENSSCWIRVAQPWAGAGWGGQHIPRMGQEVLVEFLEGDPDRPLCTGAVYNGDNAYPFSLPENKTQSGIRSRSTKESQGANELLFEDMVDHENIFVHAQKDYTERVLNTRTTRIDSHDVRSVGDNEYLTIDKASHRHVGNTSVNIVGGTGPASKLAFVMAAGTLGKTALLLAKAVALPGDSVGKETGKVAVGLLSGWIAGEGLNAFFGNALDPGFVSLSKGQNPIEDAGRDLNEGGQKLGDGAHSSPIPLGTNLDIIGAMDARLVGGAKMDVVGAFKIDYVGINHVKGIGHNHYLKIGKDQFFKIARNQDFRIRSSREIHVGENVTEVYGKLHQLDVGDNQRIKVDKNAKMQVGKEYTVLAGEKYLGESKKWEMYANESIKMSAPGGFIEITKSGILIRGKKVKIEGNKVDFKKKSGGKGAGCLDRMAKTATPFVK